MLIYALSDTHNKHKQIQVPECDLLIHAGDATNRGQHNELAPFLNWMYEQKSKYKIYVPGNHDEYAELNPVKTKQMCEDRGITLLIDEGVELEGLKIWGSPYSQKFGNWSFQEYPGEGMLKHWSKIPDKLDILITHGPAYQMLDQNMLDQSCGDYYLFYKILEMRPQAHVCGHIHEGYGQKEFDGIKFYNVACGYRSENPITEIII